ncbi:MAG: hypothetical protein AB8C84_13030 [Oligoflexales bacterium]
MISSDFFQNYLISHIQDSCSQCHIEIKSIKPHNLLGFEAKTIKFKHIQTSQNYELKSLRVSISPFSQIFVFKIPISIEVEFSNSGRFILQTNQLIWKNFSFQTLENIKVIFLNTYLKDLQDYSALFNFLPIKAPFLNARLKGVLLISHGEGKGSLRIKEPKIYIPGGSPLKFEPMRTKLLLQNSSLSFEPLELKSRLGQVTLLGSLDPFPSPTQFQLELRSPKENHLSNILGRIVNCRGSHVRISGGFNNPYCFQFPPGSLTTP